MKKEEKNKLIQGFKVHANDSGSAEVQIGISSQEIKELTKHCQEHKHDFSSRRGLLRKVSKRRQLLRYLQRTNPKSYEKIIKHLSAKTSH